jgi:potassium-transporting ATPase ATP-binding subunit
MAPTLESSAGPLGREFRGVRMAGAYNRELFWHAFKDSLAKFDPRVQIHNPVMFVVWVGSLVTLALTVYPSLFGPSNASRLYNGVVTIVLVLTVWFANYAEALAEGRGKAKAESLRKTRTDARAKRLIDPSGKSGMRNVAEGVSALDLKIGDVVLVEAGDLVPSDGEVIEGVASINESAITGESAPVIREAGGDRSAVTGGTTVVSDWIKVKITAAPGSTFIDRMIQLVEAAKRQKTPNEIALTVVLSVLTLIFVIVVAAIAPVAAYLEARINVTDLVALLVALIPTTIGALLSAIGIAGIDRTMRFNVLATSGKAVEAAGDVQP